MKLYVIPLFLAALSAQASMVTLTTPSGGTTSGGAVDATAAITTGSGTVTVVLTNLQSNPTDVAQTISDLSFTLSNGFTLSDTTSTPTATLLCIGSPTGCNAATTPVKPWGLSASGNTITLEGLFGSTIAPSQLIIGPGPYTNANGSISGNGPHNPFIDGTASFTFAVSGVTADTTVTGGTFSFGTQPEFVDAGGGGGGGGSVPEPESLVLALSGGLLLVSGRILIRKRRSA
jgi:hypothetical protein